MGKSTQIKVKVGKGGKVKVTVKSKAPGKANKPRKPNGVILYRGPSLIDGSLIVVVAIGFSRKSKNVKTGRIIQTYILADAGADPVQAIKTGGDRSICGDCPHREGTCYVNVVQAPLAIYRAVQNGSYPTFDASTHLDMFDGTFVRLGSYGDPAAVPICVWEMVTGRARRWTGYTHQWRTASMSYARFCMASCETIQQREEAASLGYRTFRVRLRGAPLEQGEFECPASEEAGKRLTCEECGACSGAKRGGRNASPSITFHGPKLGNDYRYKRYETIVAGIEERETQGRRTGLPLA